MKSIYEEVLECPKCGTEHEFGTRFCDECGTSLKEVQRVIEDDYRKYEE